MGLEARGVVVVVQVGVGAGLQAEEFPAEGGDVDLEGPLWGGAVGEGEREEGVVGEGFEGLVGWLGLLLRFLLVLCGLWGGGGRGGGEPAARGWEGTAGGGRRRAQRCAITVGGRCRKEGASGRRCLVATNGADPGGGATRWQRD